MAEIIMECVHGRRTQNTRTFKGMVNGLLVTSLMLATVLGSTTPAFAAEVSIKDLVQAHQNEVVQQTKEYGMSVEQSISSLKNTISELNRMRKSGQVSDTQLKLLASQLYTLESAVKSSHKGVTEDVKLVISDVEKAIEGLPNASVVEVALAIVKANLGIDSYTIPQVKAGNELKSFSDVPKSHWAHDAIMDMVSKGLFSGTTTPVNGVGTFAPEATMTRAQFVTVVTRYLYADELATMGKQEGTAWYANNYEVALDHGLLKEHEFENGNLNKAMTRQEMALVLSRACDELGEKKIALISDERIPDYNTIGTYYRSAVKTAYSKGMICGIDAAGTFNPKGTLNRAQAATVLYRLVEPSTRSVVDYTVREKEEIPTGSQVFNEFAKHQKPQAGDICVKADGTRVEVKVGPGGVLRAEGCDIYTGVVINGITTKEGMLHWDDGRPFKKDSKTGEMYSIADWNDLKFALNPTGKMVGDYDGEIYNTWFKWNSALGIWTWTGPTS